MAGHGRQELNETIPLVRNIQTTEGNTEEGPNIKERWVVNLSSQPLTEAETKLLTHRPNFAVTSRMCNHHGRDLPKTGKR